MGIGKGFTCGIRRNLCLVRLSGLPYNQRRRRDAQPAPYQENYLGDHVHIVAGLSKDWGMSGFRVGTLFSHNTKLLQALDLVGYYQTVSQYTQHALTQVFSDDAWVDWYIAENQQRLWDTYQAMVAALARINVPVTPAQGALFAWVSLSSRRKR